MRNIFRFWFLIFILLLLFHPTSFALDAFDQAQFYLENGDIDRAIQILKPLINSSNQDELSQVVEVLYALLSEKGQNEEAIHVLQVFIEKFPRTQEAYLYRYWTAKTKEDNQQYHESLELLQKIVDEYPSDIGDPFNIRQQAMEDIAHHQELYFEDYAEAINSYLIILSRYPDFEEKSRILIQVASCYEKMNQLDKAMEFYQKIRFQETDPYYLDLAELRIEYLQANPTWARDNPAHLIKELRDAFAKKDLQAIEKLAKKGDFWAGQMFSEFEIVRFSQILQYFSTYLNQSNLQFHPAEKRENEYILKITSWGDPDFSILYLSIEKGIYGWEWSKVVLSNPEIEYQVNNFNNT
ncbi:MAG: tetratricopeptide repeat protein [Candidatus Atribacteria bacterium]|nr:tetratricopeptide repeat protein [Candidatus Atribacteria bacterium]